MAVPELYFSPPYDIHLLRGQSITLFDLLMVGDKKASVYKTSNPTIEWKFTLLFKGALTGTTYSGLNIEVNTTTGKITTQATAPAVEKRNFIIEVKAKDPADMKESETKIRVHIHQGITEAWLSPSPLTVYKGINGFKFSVRARFDDDVVAEIGDIYNGDFGDKVNYNFSPAWSIEWTSPTSGLITSTTGEIKPSSSVALGDHDVTADITCMSHNIQATGKIKVSDVLSGTRADIVAELVSTGNSPGFAMANDVVNILFIPDGFLDTDKSSFDAMVDNYVSFLMNDPVNLPFYWLTGCINFWKVFIPSREREATHRCEIYPVSSARYALIPFVERPDLATIASWNFKQMFYHAGLPVAADAAKSEATIISEWKQTLALTDAEVDSMAGIFSVSTWQDKGARRYPEEKDTALGLHINDYTAADKDDLYELIHFSRKRMTRDKLDTFLNALKDPAGNAIGKLFTSSGKDRDNIAFITTAVNGRAQNIDKGFFSLVNDEKNSVNISSPGTDLKAFIEPDTLPNEFPLKKKATITHELSHSFGLGDEYGENPPDKNFDQKTIDDPLVAGWPHAVFDQVNRKEFDLYSNIQPRSDLLSPDPADPTKGRLDADKIKWRWHRIRVGRVVKSISKSGSTYTITLKPFIPIPSTGPGTANLEFEFKKDDVVILRKRKRDEPIATVKRVTSATPAITSDTITQLISEPMQVSVAPTDPLIIKTTVSSGAALPADFLTVAADEEMILYSPVVDTGGNLLELISSAVRTAIQNDPVALNVDAATKKEIIDSSPEQSVTSTNATITAAIAAAPGQKITALFTGGKTFHGHAYHSSGSCFMRVQAFDKKTTDIDGTTKSEIVLTEYCPVCMYTLVNMMEPSRHAYVNHLYGDGGIGSRSFIIYP